MPWEPNSASMCCTDGLISVQLLRDLLPISHQICDSPAVVLLGPMHRRRPNLDSRVR
jgi:hypothetical protein